MFPSLNYAVLTHALAALKEGNFRYCETLGFTFDELNALNQLSLDELFIVIRASTQFMSITVHHDALQQILTFSREEAHHQQQINRAIKLRGSIALLNHFLASPQMRSVLAAGCWVSPSLMAERLSLMKLSMPKSGCHGKRTAMTTLILLKRWKR
jgi:hypothetical protein